MKNYLKYIFVFIFAILLFFYRGEFSAFLGNARLFVVSFFDRSFDYQTFTNLKIENQKIKAELKNLEESPAIIKPITHNFKYLNIPIYVFYPFSVKSSLVINVGSENNIKIGMPIAISDGVLLGKISKVERTQSNVLTIFDPNWKSSITIGEFKEKALLSGANVPRITLISEKAKIKEGDNVFNFSSDFPLGFLLGTIKNLKKDSSNSWLEADLDVLYNPEDLREVSIITDFP